MPDNEETFRLRLDDGGVDAKLDACAKRFEELARASDDASKALRGASDASHDAGNAADEAGDKWGKLNAFLNAEGIQKVADGLRQIAGAGQELAANLQASVKSASDYVDALGDWSTVLGTTATDMENFSRVVQQAGGGGMEEAGKMLQKFNQAVFEARKGSDGMINTFAAVGVNAKDTSKSTYQLAQQYLQNLTNMQDKQAALAAGMAVFGKGAREYLAEVLSSGQTFDQLMTSAGRYGNLTAEQISALDQAHNSVLNLELAERRLADVTGATLAPAYAAAQNKLADFIGEISKDNPALATFIGIVGSSAGPILQATAGVIQFAAGLRILLIGTAAAEGGFKALLAAGLNPVTAGVVAAIAAITLLVGWLIKLYTETATAQDRAKRFNDHLLEMTKRGYLSADAMQALHIEIEKLPSVWDRAIVGVYEFGRATAKVVAASLAGLAALINGTLNYAKGAFTGDERSWTEQFHAAYTRYNRYARGWLMEGYEDAKRTMPSVSGAFAKQDYEKQMEQRIKQYGLGAEAPTGGDGGTGGFDYGKFAGAGKQKAKANEAAKDLAQEFGDAVITSLGKHFNEFGSRSCANALKSMMLKAGGIASDELRHYNLNSVAGWLEFMKDAPSRFTRMPEGSVIDPNAIYVRARKDSDESHIQTVIGNRIYGTHTVKRGPAGVGDTRFQEQGKGYTRVGAGDVVYRVEGRRKSPVEAVQAEAEVKASAAKTALQDADEAVKAAEEHLRAAQDNLEAAKIRRQTEALPELEAAVAGAQAALADARSQRDSIAGEAKRAEDEAKAAAADLAAARKENEEQVKAIEGEIQKLRAEQSLAREQGELGRAGQLDVEIARREKAKAELTPEDNDDAATAIGLEETMLRVRHQAEQRQMEADTEAARFQYDKSQLLHQSLDEQKKRLDTLVNSLKRYRDWLLQTGKATEALRVESEMLRLTEEKRQRLTLGQEMLLAGTSASSIQDFLNQRFNNVTSTFAQQSPTAPNPLDPAQVKALAEGVVGDAKRVLDAVLGMADDNVIGGKAGELRAAFQEAVAKTVAAMFK